MVTQQEIKNLIGGLKEKMKYRIVYVAPEKGIKDKAAYQAWREDTQEFIPAGLHLYVTTYPTIEAAMQARRAMKDKTTGWHDDIYIESIAE